MFSLPMSMDCFVSLAISESTSSAAFRDVLRPLNQVVEPISTKTFESSSVRLMENHVRKRKGEMTNNPMVPQSATFP
jgi:hypothetical protein